MKQFSVREFQLHPTKYLKKLPLVLTQVQDYPYQYFVCLGILLDLRQPSYVISDLMEPGIISHLKTSKDTVFSRVHKLPITSPSNVRNVFREHYSVSNVFWNPNLSKYTEGASLAHWHGILPILSPR